MNGPSTPLNMAGKTDVSLVTSLYRSSDFLAAYSKAVLRLADELNQAGVSLEMVLVANDASTVERALIADLEAAARRRGTFRLEVLFVERETIYASWNRAMALSSGECLGVWGVDDVRFADAIIEGAELIKAKSCDLVDFPFVLELQRRYFGVLSHTVRRQCPAQYDPTALGPKACVSPFFLMSRDLYLVAGPFDDRFRVSGDYEWSKRSAVRSAHCCSGNHIGGVYLSHGGNLSGGSNNQRERAEQNVVLLRFGQWETVKAVEPEVMRAVRDVWVSDLDDVPDEVAEWLWGSRAETTWAAWKRAKSRERVAESLRWLPRHMITAFGLRPLLTRLGVVQPAQTREHGAGKT